MKLLICTQAIDKNNILLGFFHKWVEEFAKLFEEVNIICLTKGEYVLPSNVHVYSLGKEGGISRIKYLTRFYKYAWKLRNKHDVVFVHMNPHYVVLGGLFWAIKNKRIFFWRNHARMNVMTRIAAFFAEKVFYTSPYACTSRFKHSIQMPVGIDTEIFTRLDNIEKKENSVLLLGRLSKVKRSELLMQASHFLSDHQIYVYGNDPLPEQKYGTMLRKVAAPNVTFYDSVINRQTPSIYNSHEIYVNLTPEGSMDKTVLEAAACGALVLVTNTSFQKYLPEEFFIKDESPEGIAEKIREISNYSNEQKKRYSLELQDMVIKNHSIKRLMEDFVELL